MAAGRGTLLYISDREGGRDLYQLHLTRAGRPTGDATRLTTGLDAARVSVAADGRRLAYATFTQNSNVWSLPIPVSGVTGLSRAEPVTTGMQLIESFDISPDGRWLAFDSDRGGTCSSTACPSPGTAKSSSSPRAPSPPCLRHLTGRAGDRLPRLPPRHAAGLRHPR